MQTRPTENRLPASQPATTGRERRGDRSHKAIDRPLTRFRLATGPFRLLPDYIIIGAQKCGTSSLYRYISEHPSAAPAIGKEVHFFDWHFERGPSWYRAHFPSMLYGAAFRARTGRKLVTGEASPYYIFHPHVPARVKALLPQVKLIAMLRDPVERAISSYFHQVRSGNETLTLAEALEQEPARITDAAERLAGGQKARSRAHRKFSYLARGIYADQLEGWLEHFPREQLLVLRSEDLFADPAQSLARVFEFLGLPAWQAAQFPRFNAGEYSDVDPAVRDWLVRYFAPHNERLYALLGRDFGWAR